MRLLSLSESSIQPRTSRLKLPRILRSGLAEQLLLLAGPVGRDALERLRVRAPLLRGLGLEVRDLPLVLLPQLHLVHRAERRQSTRAGKPRVAYPTVKRLFAPHILRYEA